MTSVRYLCWRFQETSSIPMSKRRLSRPGSSSSSHTRLTIRPTVSQSIRSIRLIVVLSVRVASRATRHSKSRVNSERGRANGTPSVRAPCTGHHSRRRRQWISSRQTPKSRWRQTESSGRVSLRPHVEYEHFGHWSFLRRSATSTITRSGSNRTFRTLDRPGGFSHVRLLAPLAHRDYRLLVGGMSVSLLGDGLFPVALACQVYALSDAPTALATVGIAMTIPPITCLLIGGAVSDRYHRRLLMLTADTARAVILATLAALAVTGALELWEPLLIAVVYGPATAFFNPASDALVPQLPPEEELAQANSLDQLIRPLALRLAGPALGGLLVDAIGSGRASAWTRARSRSRSRRCWRFPPRRRPAARLRTRRRLGSWRGRSVRLPLRPQARLALGHAGERHDRLPAVHRPDRRAAAIHRQTPVRRRPRDLGLIFATGGLGSLVRALAVGQLGSPPQPHLHVRLLVWPVQPPVGPHARQRALQHARDRRTIACATAKQRHVPAPLLGRVSSPDWLISIGPLPVSYALTGPINATVGARTTLIGAGVLGAIMTLAPLLIPSVRHLDNTDASGPRLEEPPVAQGCSGNQRPRSRQSRDGPGAHLARD